MAIYDIPTDDLKRPVNPLDGVMWKCGPISANEIEIALKAGIVEKRIWNDVVNVLNRDEARQYHINRIATLIREPQDDRLTLVLENHKNPLVAYLNDGNHRLAAAYLRGTPNLRVLVAAGVPEKISDVLPRAKLVKQ